MMISYLCISRLSVLEEFGEARPLSTSLDCSKSGAPPKYLPIPRGAAAEPSRGPGVGDRGGDRLAPATDGARPLGPSGIPAQRGRPVGSRPAAVAPGGLRRATVAPPPPCPTPSQDSQT